ncbi:hypothetical protein EDB92DRAFT_143200 [Lactarius akahatsu]|uniref:Uncharacterized protein n=1 Tax=Lactarius akahatsu TaxID=416441 RepID=A0AAD4Q3R8_9AGAM|nr:hypothetical protein EDB92DRAFT_143200 [Lactarius akahatsu]
MLFLHPRQSDSPLSSLFSSSIPLTLSSSHSTTSPLSTSSETRTESTTTPTTSNASSSFTSTPTPTSTSTSTFDTLSSSSPSSSSFRDTSSSSHSTSETTPPPPSSSSSTPTVSSTSSSGLFLSTLTTSFVTNINGVPTTIVTPIVTSLHGSTPIQASSRTAVIAGSAIGGLVLFIIGLSAIFIFRRRVRRQRYWALSRKRLPSRSTFLAGESMDLPQSSPPFAYADTDDPFATRISRHPSGGSGSVGTPSFPYAYAYSHESDIPHVRTASPVPSSPPRLFRPRASESGSIFQESVWPPPSAASQLTDPLTSPSHAVDLGSIVDEVMGTAGVDSGGRDHAREQSGMSEMGPLLDADDDAVPTLTLTNPDPQSPQSPLQPPETSPQTPPRPPRWLSRSPNPSPKSSPLHIARAL